MACTGVKCTKHAVSRHGVYWCKSKDALSTRMCRRRIQTDVFGVKPALVPNLEPNSHWRTKKHQHIYLSNDPYSLPRSLFSMHSLPYNHVHSRSMNSKQWSRLCSQWSTLSPQIPIFHAFSPIQPGWQVHSRTMNSKQWSRLSSQYTWFPSITWHSSHDYITNPPLSPPQKQLATSPVLTLDKTRHTFWQLSQQTTKVLLTLFPFAKTSTKEQNPDLQ